MKILIIVTLIFFTGICVAKSQHDWMYYTIDEIEALKITAEKKERLKDMKYLSWAKRFLLNGDTSMAKVYLNKIFDKETKVLPLKRRYQAIISFIEGNYEHSYQLIDTEYFNHSSRYKDTCPLKIMNLLAMKRPAQFSQEVRHCKKINEQFSETDFLWPTYMTYIKNNAKDFLAGESIGKMRDILTSKDSIKLWIKTGLYINQEKKLIPYILEMSEDLFKSKSVRELLGITFYRQGKIEKALNFVEDIDGPNAENLKAAIEINKRQYELAFGHLQLALRRKKNSFNALSRIVPVALYLGQFKEGIKYLEQIENTRSLDPKVMMLKLAFHLLNNDIPKAQLQLNMLDAYFVGQFPLHIEQMKTMIGLAKFDNQEFIEGASRSCQKNDGLGCYLLMQSMIWKNLGKTLNRKESIQGNELTNLDDYKEKRDYTPIDEPLLLDQRDIEEMDEQFIVIR